VHYEIQVINVGELFMHNISNTGLLSLSAKGELVVVPLIIFECV